MKNISIMNSTFSNIPIVYFRGIKNMAVSNFVLDTIVSTNLFSNHLIEFNQITGSNLSINGFYVMNSAISNAKSILYGTSLSGTISGENIHFLNNRLSNSVSMIRLDEYKDVNFDQVRFEENNNQNKDDSLMINLDHISSRVDSSILFSNVTVINSTIPLLKLSNPEQSKSIDQQITFDGIIYKNWAFTFSTNLIHTENVKSDGILSVVFNKMIFSNISFSRLGNLLYLQHQANEEVQINNSVFSDIYFAGIAAESFDKNSLDKRTLVRMSNITAHNINGVSGSFIQIFEGVTLTVTDSSFYYITNYGSGGVISAGYQAAVADIFNSEFYNNTSVEGGVFVAESKSVVKWTNWTFTENFAISSGVGKARNDGYFELNSCTISGNKAMIAPISELFSTQLTSTINGCSISGNIGVTPSFITENILTISKFPYYYIDYIPNTYRDFITSNSFILSQPQLPESIQVILASLSIKNQTIVAGQDHFLFSIYSTVSINGLTMKNVMLTKNAFALIETTITLADIEALNITSNHNVNLFELSSGTMSVNGLTYSNSTVRLLLSTFSQIEFGNLHITKISGVEHLVSLRECSVSSFYNSTFGDINAYHNYALESYDTNFSSIQNVQFKNIVSTVILMHDNYIGQVTNLTIDNATSGIFFHESKVDLITQSAFMNSGSLNDQDDKCLYFQNSEFRITDSIFKLNKGVNGGAINIKCYLGKACNSTISGSVFENNAASNKGGAIYYNSYRPEMQQNTFSNNSALYGNNIGSYAVKIVECSTTNNKLNIENVPSGLAYNQTLKFALVDYDGQIMNLENSNVAKISSSIAEVSISGIDYAKFTNGISKFSNIVFVGMPGRKNAEYFVTTNAIDSAIVTNALMKTPSDATDYETKLIVNFRYCQPGEVQTARNTCRECSYGTYSLEWNSRVWENCMDNVEWLGRDQISVDEGFWRKNKNSTTIIECLREKSWEGGYVENSLHPIKCAEGYGGYLCTQCEIVDGKKYQPLSGFEWARCPDPTLNAIRVVGFIILAMMFLAAIIVVNIRKTKENQTSILFRILTNYIQLISAALSFNIKLPGSFSNVFSQSERFGSPNESFFSFDWFIEDYEIKGFAPSNSLFKVFLFSLLPVILIIVVTISLLIFVWISKLVKKDKTYDMKRFVGVSFISIVFLFHPTMAFSALNVLQWSEIDENDSRMRLHMEYKWYSAEHMLWCIFIALPMLAVWVIGMPLSAFLVMYKYRGNLEDWHVKKYFLILYQGLRKETFYWEFVNTSRKILILVLNVFLYSYSPYYRILIAIGKAAF
jgi:hypothetical protein